jgi:hypothetical protein
VILSPKSAETRNMSSRVASMSSMPSRNRYRPRAAIVLLTAQSSRKDAQVLSATSS